MADEKVAAPVPQLNSHNYATWKPRMHALFVLKDLAHVLASGAESAATSGTSAEQRTAAVAQFKKDQSKVHALITIHLSDQFTYLSTAHATGSELWKALDSLFASKLTARVFDLETSLLRFEKQPSEDIHAYVGRLRTVHNELVSAGGDMQSKLASILLRGLPEDYHTVRTSLMISNISDIDAIVPYLLQHEQHMKEKETPEHKAFFSAKYNRGPMRFGGPGQGQIMRSGGMPSSGKPGGSAGGSKQFNGNCNYCGVLGHRASECRKQQRDLAQRRGQQSQSRNQQSGARKPASMVNLALAAPSVAMPAPSSSSSSGNTSTWFLDSAASRHVTSDRSALVPSSVRPADPQDSVTTLTGTQVPVDVVGDVILRPDGSCTTLLLRNVACSAAAGYSLISLSQAAQSGVGSLITPGPNTACQLLKRHRVGPNGQHGMRPVVIVPSNGTGVYPMSATVLKGARRGGELACLASHARPESGGGVPQPEADVGGSGSQPLPPAERQAAPVLWHRRFAHMAYSSLAQMQEQQMVTGLSVTAAAFRAAGDSVCEPCALGKQPRASFASVQRDTVSSAPTDMVHMDIAGPIKPSTMGGANYYLGAVHEDFKFSIAVPLRAKSDAPAVVKEIIAFFETQSARLIRIVRTDNGGEFVNKTLGTYFKDNGIVHQTTAPYTPEQNGVAERLNRTLMERVRAVLADSSLPGDMWGELLVAVNYLRNRSPTAHRAATPWELLHGRKPDVSNLRVLGSRAFVHIPKATRTSKLQPVTQPGRLVGYEPDSKAYRVLLDNGRRVTVSASVTFDESAPPAAAAAVTAPHHEFIAPS